MDPLDDPAEAEFNARLDPEYFREIKDDLTAYFHDKKVTADDAPRYALALMDAAQRMVNGWGTICGEKFDYEEIKGEATKAFGAVGAAIGPARNGTTPLRLVLVLLAAAMMSTSGMMSLDGR
jgi:hypothetical protein